MGLEHIWVLLVGRSIYSNDGVFHYDAKKKTSWKEIKQLLLQEICIFLYLWSCVVRKWAKYSENMHKQMKNSIYVFSHTHTHTHTHTRTQPTCSYLLIRILLERIMCVWSCVCVWCALLCVRVHACVCVRMVDVLSKKELIMRSTLWTRTFHSWLSDENNFALR